MAVANARQTESFAAAFRGRDLGPRLIRFRLGRSIDSRPHRGKLRVYVGDLDVGVLSHQSAVDDGVVLAGLERVTVR